MVVIGGPFVFPVWRIFETTVAGIGSVGAARPLLMRIRSVFEKVRIVNRILAGKFAGEN